MKKRSRKAKTLRGKSILLIITGSIAAYKVGDLIQAMREEGARVVCVMTEGAKEFVTPLTVRAISGEKVYDDFFSTKTVHDVLHTELAEQADAVLVCPASANFVARAASGFASDLASCILLATNKPVLMVPAMNDQMYEHPLTRQNLATLKSVGYQLVSPKVGHLVCGREAIGHVADEKTIIDKIKSCLS